MRKDCALIPEYFFSAVAGEHGQNIVNNMI